MYIHVFHVLYTCTVYLYLYMCIFYMYVLHVMEWRYYLFIIRLLIKWRFEERVAKQMEAVKKVGIVTADCTYSTCTCTVKLFFIVTISMRKLLVPFRM